MRGTVPVQPASIWEVRVKAARRRFPTGSKGPVSDAADIIRSLYPQARLTSGPRDPNSALGRANPHSWHNVVAATNYGRAAEDVAPIQGMTFNDYVNGFKTHGYSVLEARDEAANPLPWTTGPNWHVVLGR